MQVIDMFAEQHNLPRGMHRRIRAYFDYVNNSNTNAHESDNDLIEGLSPQLRMDLRLFLYADIISKVLVLKMGWLFIL